MVCSRGRSCICAFAGVPWVTAAIFGGCGTGRGRGTGRAADSLRVSTDAAGSKNFMSHGTNGSMSDSLWGKAGVTKSVAQNDAPTIIVAPTILVVVLPIITINLPRQARCQQQSEAEISALFLSPRPISMQLRNTPPCRGKQCCRSLTQQQIDRLCDQNQSSLRLRLIVFTIERWPSHRVGRECGFT